MWNEGSAGCGNLRHMQGALDFHQRSARPIDPRIPDDFSSLECQRLASVVHSPLGLVGTGSVRHGTYIVGGGGTKPSASAVGRLSAIRLLSTPDPAILM